MTEEREHEVLDKALDWFSEHFSGEDLKEILSKNLGLSEDEIKEESFDILFDEDYDLINGGVIQ